MIRYGKKMIARAGYYLENGDNKFMCLPYEEGAEYKEIAFNGELSKINDNVFNLSDVMAITLNDRTKANLVGCLFSTDDQMAIMLNKDDSPEDAAVYALMQEWRAYFSVLIKRMKQL